jgi:hypothetical protein
MNTHTPDTPTHDNHGDSANTPSDPQSHKDITIFINTREFTLHQKNLTYQELVDLAFPGNISSPEKIYEITYSSDHGLDGKVGVDGNVKLKEGMVFNVGLTNRS